MKSKKKRLYFKPELPTCKTDDYCLPSTACRPGCYRLTGLSPFIPRAVKRSIRLKQGGRK